MKFTKGAGNLRPIYLGMQTFVFWPLIPPPPGEVFSFSNSLAPTTQDTTIQSNFPHLHNSGNSQLFAF